jgi:hypothetical protein
LKNLQKNNGGKNMATRDVIQYENAVTEAKKEFLATKLGYNKWSPYTLDQLERIAMVTDEGLDDVNTKCTLTLYEQFKQQIKWTETINECDDIIFDNRGLYSITKVKHVALNGDITIEGHYTFNVAGEDGNGRKLRDMCETNRDEVERQEIIYALKKADFFELNVDDLRTIRKLFIGKNAWTKE